MATERATLAVVGFGNMGGAIIRGALAAGVLPEAEICVAEPDDARRGEAEDVGLRVFADPAEAIAKTSPRYVMLAIKPQMLAGLAQSVLPRAGFGGRVGFLYPWRGRRSRGSRLRCGGRRWCG